MHIKLLIDAIMQQTTVLISQLATAAGVRAPLSGIADQVFVELARDLEAQGVGRRVAADMFGMALRSYQKKLRRLTECQSGGERTLWSAVLQHIREHERVRKVDLLVRFAHDGEREVGAILTDLVGTGLIYQTGRGREAMFRITSDVDLRHLSGRDDPQALAPLLWSTVHDSPGMSAHSAYERLGISPGVGQATLSTLLADGRLRRVGEGDGAQLYAEDLTVPVGAVHGWEVAVSDHFRAVANAIASKVRSSGAPRSQHEDVVGGGTLSFDLSVDHPYREQALALLQETRARANALWDAVEAHNAQHPIGEDARQRLFFYFGQYMEQDELEPSALEGEV